MSQGQREQDIIKLTYNMQLPVHASSLLGCALEWNIHLVASALLFSPVVKTGTIPTANYPRRMTLPFLRRPAVLVAPSDGSVSTTDYVI